MTRKPTNIIKIIRPLFALSGNKCAFPNCRQEIIDENNHVIGEICHIEAANTDGPRFNQNQTDEERRSLNNLILLCPTHHKIVDCNKKYTVEKLRKLKYEHEQKYRYNNYLVKTEILEIISAEFKKLWDEIKIANTQQHIFQELAIEIEVNKNFIAIANEQRRLLKILSKQINYVSHTIDSQNQSLSNYLDDHFFRVFPNILKKIAINMDLSELKYLETYIKSNLTDSKAHMRMLKLSKKMLFDAQHALYID